MKKPQEVRGFRKGSEPKGRTRPFADPIVCHFPPAAYRVVQPDELKEWQQEVKERLGLMFDFGNGSVGTVTYSNRRGSTAAHRSDADIESDSDIAVEDERRRSGRLQRWDAKPVVLHYQPAVYTLVEADELKDWTNELTNGLGVGIDISEDWVRTTSFCVGPQNEGFPCDCDVG